MNELKYHISDFKLDTHLYPIIVCPKVVNTFDTNFSSNNNNTPLHTHSRHRYLIVTILNWINYY